ncbi:MAG: PA2778 family cysteine peptidase [Deltaproteobacteria bacterium]|nr:PA2778 family cysteine peptidase [Deltaproteobacteria bacterium]
MPNLFFPFLHYSNILLLQHSPPPVDERGELGSITFRGGIVGCRITILLSVVLTMLMGCSAFQRTPMPLLPENVPSSHELDTVPFYPQDAYQCGPATLAMALTWSGLAVAPDELNNQVYSPSRKGSLQLAMVGATRRHGKIAYEINDPDSIFPEIAAGHPVIILQNLGLSWLPVWHYAVAIGYDLNEEVIILRSGTARRKLMSYYLFEKTWARSNYWGLMVLEPTQVPVLANENEYLQAVLGLEKSNHFDDAVTGYQTALGRWPRSLTALMGLGNSYYALGDMKGAEYAFRKATELYQQSAPAYNNLAQVLFEQGRKQEALAAAQRAVDLGGPLKSISEKTLQEIQSEIP